MMPVVRLCIPRTGRLKVRARRLILLLSQASLVHAFYLSYGVSARGIDRAMDENLPYSNTIQENPLLMLVF